MFTIKDVDFQSEDYGVEPYLNNWPMLYILENGKKAYVGQTNSTFHLKTFSDLMMLRRKNMTF